jgi:hypothetical protein
MMLSPGHRKTQTSKLGYESPGEDGSLPFLKNGYAGIPFPVKSAMRMTSEFSDQHAEHHGEIAGHCLTVKAQFAKML